MSGRSQHEIWAANPKPASISVGEPLQMGSAELTGRRGDGSLQSEVHLWPVSLQRSAPEVERLRSLLSSDERNRADRYHSRDDALRYAVGRGWLRRLLGWYTGISPREIVFSYGRRGKPELSNPGGVPDIRFNLSHTREWIMYAFTLGRDVGVDIESDAFAEESVDNYLRFLAPAEREQIQSLAQGQRARQFLTYWVRKEACLKAIGCGFAISPEEVDVSSIPTVSLCLPLEGTEKRISVHVVDLSSTGGTRGAFALVGGEMPIRMRQFSPHQDQR